jgi:hypothetical protein
MIPVVISLIHTALETSIIREELDQGLKDNKDYGRDAKEAMKLKMRDGRKRESPLKLGSRTRLRKLRYDLMHGHVLWLMFCTRTVPNALHTKSR